MENTDEPKTYEFGIKSSLDPQKVVDAAIKHSAGKLVLLSIKGSTRDRRVHNPVWSSCHYIAAAIINGKPFPLVAAPVTGTSLRRGGERFALPHQSIGHAQEDFANSLATYFAVGEFAVRVGVEAEKRGVTLETYIPHQRGALFLSHQQCQGNRLVIPYAELAPYIKPIDLERVSGQ